MFSKIQKKFIKNLNMITTNLKVLFKRRDMLISYRLQIN